MADEILQEYPIVSDELGLYLPLQGDASVSCVVIDLASGQRIRLYLRTDHPTMLKAYYALKKQVERQESPAPQE